MNFKDLNLPEPILKALEVNNYVNPTPIQQLAIPAALAGKDLLLSAQTGSGKTAAFLLPILTHLLAGTNKSKKIRAVILTPTRELAQQVQTQVRKYGKNMPWLYSVPLVGGASYSGQIQALKKGVQIVVATPGRFLDHHRDGRLNLDHVDVLVIDEADRMLDMGFADDMNAIIEALPIERQTIMCSATWDGMVGKIAAKYTKNAEKIKIEAKTGHIEENVYFCDNQEHKNNVLRHILGDANWGQTLIFTATKSMSEEVSDMLRDNGYRARFMHGDLPQGKRSRIIDDLRKGKVDILVATDVVARGIDISSISHVINYDLPRQVEDYVHRIGRSGRAGRNGTAISLCSLSDRRPFADIKHYLGRAIEESVIEGLEPRAVPKPKSKPKKKFRNAPEKDFKKRSTKGKSFNSSNKREDSFKSKRVDEGFSKHHDFKVNKNEDGFKNKRDDDKVKHFNREEKFRDFNSKDRYFSEKPQPRFHGDKKFRNDGFAFERKREKDERSGNDHKRKRF